MDAATAQAAPAQAAATPARPLVDQCCVGCHNERLKSGELVLAGVDLTDAARNAAVMARWRASCEAAMPPEGRPRPDKPTLDAFIAGLEGALDRHAAEQPNPGRVASRRLNRAEYVNAVYDLLGLEVNGAELPSDMAASLRQQRRRAVDYLLDDALHRRGDEDRRSVVPDRPSEVYKVGFESRALRANEDMPFGTNGGLAVRHAFPLDGDEFRIKMKRNGTVSTIEGIDEDEHDSSCGSITRSSSSSRSAASTSRIPACSSPCPKTTRPGRSCTTIG